MLHSITLCYIVLHLFVFFRNFDGFERVRMQSVNDMQIAVMHHYRNLLESAILHIAHHEERAELGILDGENCRFNILARFGDLADIISGALFLLHNHFHDRRDFVAVYCWITSADLFFIRWRDFLCL